MRLSSHLLSLLTCAFVFRFSFSACAFTQTKFAFAIRFASNKILIKITCNNEIEGYIYAHAHIHRSLAARIANAGCIAEREQTVEVIASCFDLCCVSNSHSIASTSCHRQVMERLTLLADMWNSIETFDVFWLFFKNCAGFYTKWLPFFVYID